MRRSSLALLFLAVAAASPAKADEKSEALLRAFIAGIDAFADWTATAGSVRSEGSDTIAEGLVFGRENPRVSVSIERLQLEDLETEPEGGFTASRIELTGGAAVSDLLDYSIPNASVDNVSVPSTAGIVFDPHHLMTFASQIYSVMAGSEFSKFTVPEMTSTQRQPGMDGGSPVTSTVVYRNLTSTGLENGILDRSEVGPISVSIGTPDGEVRFDVRSVSGDRMDMGAFAHVFDASQYRDGRGDGIWRPLVSRFAYTGFSGTGPEGATFKLDEVAVENIDGRQTDRPFTTLWDKLLDPAVSEDSKSDLALEAVRGMYAAWRVGTVRMDGLAVDVPAEQTDFGLGAFTMSGLSNEGIDSFLVKNIHAKGPGGYGSLENFEFAGLVFPDLDALMKFAALENDADPQTHEETLRATFAALPRLAHFGMHGLAGGESEERSVKVEDVALDLRDWNDFFAQAIDFRVEGVDVPRELMQLDPQAAQMFDTLGFDRVVAGMSLSDRWSAENGTDDAKWIVTVKDAMDVALSYSLTGITADWIIAATAEAGRTEDSQAALMKMLSSLSLASAELRVTDRSLLDRGFGVAAKMQNLSIGGEAYREQMRGALPFLLSAAIPSDLAKAISKPLQDFMAGNQTLVAEIKPPAPVPLVSIIGAANTNPMDLPTLLGVMLRSEAAP